MRVFRVARAWFWWRFSRWAYHLHLQLMAEAVLRRTGGQVVRRDAIIGHPAVDLVEYATALELSQHAADFAEDYQHVRAGVR